MAVKPPMTAVEFGKDYETDQIYSTGIEFALVGRQNKQWKQATTFVFCKDFLHDAIWSQLNQQAVRLYGFHYAPIKGFDGTQNIPPEPTPHTGAWYDWNENYGDSSISIPTAESLPLHLGRTSLLMRNGDLKGVKGTKLFHSHRVGCLDFLRQLEKRMGLRRSEISVVKGKKTDAPTWLILGDKRWMIAPPMISLFALLLRVGYYHNQGGSAQRTLEMMRDEELGDWGNDDVYDDSQSENDASYLSQAWKGVQLILKHGPKVFHEKMIENYPGDVKPNTIHNDYGLVNFSSKRPEKRVPYWYRKSLWK